MDTTSVPGTGPTLVQFSSKDHLIASAESIERDLPSLRKYYASRAKMIRAYYDSLIDAGFDNEDALILCSQEFDNS